MYDIPIIIRHIPTEVCGRANYVGIDINTQDYKIIIFDRELTKVKLESLHANYIKSGGKIKWI